MKFQTWRKYFVNINKIKEYFDTFKNHINVINGRYIFCNFVVPSVPIRIHLHMPVHQLTMSSWLTSMAWLWSWRNMFFHIIVQARKAFKMRRWNLQYPLPTGCQKSTKPTWSYVEAICGLWVYSLVSQSDFWISSPEMRYGVPKRVIKKFL